MKRKDWHIHLLVFLVSLFFCIVGYQNIMWGYSTDNTALNTAAIAKSISGSALLIVGASGILLQYYLYVKSQNDDND